MPTTQPSLESYGEAGAYYFLHEPDWLRRHVETLVVLSDREAMRRLTIDLVLPDDPSTWVAEQADDVVYCVPLTRLSKEKPPAFVDLRSEDGSALPLLTREENAQISIAALEAALAELLGTRWLADPFLELAVRELVLEPPEPAGLAVGVFDAAAKSNPRLSDHVGWRRVEQAVAQLQGNELVWLPLVASPRGRKVIKFCYRIPLHGGTVVAPGPHKTLGAVQKRVARLTAVMGWDAIRYSLDDVYVEGPPSYHLQVRTPEGLSLEERIGVQGIPEDLLSDTPGDHLYVRGAHDAGEAEFQLAFRPARAGLVNLSLLSAVAIVGLLWLTVARAETLTGAGDETHAQIGAAVLLIVPALLVGFATVPAASPLAAALLTGVRISAIACGLAAAATAAALAGVRYMPTFELSAAINATVASAAGIAILITWLATFDGVRAVVGTWRRSWLGSRLPDVPMLAIASATAAAAGVLSWWVVPAAGESLAYSIAGATLLGCIAVGLVLRSRGWRPRLVPVTLATATAAAIAALLEHGNAIPAVAREVASAVALAASASGIGALLLDLLAPIDPADLEPEDPSGGADQLDDRHASTP
jgi:hypothetical protein